MRKYPVGIQDLSEIITGGYVYVDKTPFIHQLLTQGKYYFLSRPRRFGKSLFISTLYYLFKAKKELFEGMYIYDKWDWNQTNPIIKISFSNIGHSEIGLHKAIENALMDIAKSHDLDLTAEGNGPKFKELIEKLHEKYDKVAVLIDEYDKPIIDYIDTNIPKAIENRGILKAFYSILKDADPHLKLVFITGVSKFSKISIFSDLNNLQDITLHPLYSGICGITQSELDSCFREEQEKFDAKAVKQWYNGYNWLGKESVYNPFSLLNFFSAGIFKNYWFVSGTPTFLMSLAKKYQKYEFEHLEMSGTQLDAYNVENLQLSTLMFQTGYLTIKKYDEEDDLYLMGYPNEEVRKSYLEFLADAYANSQDESVRVLATQMRNALREQNFFKVQSIFNTIFKGIPYEVWQKENEHYYHALIHLIFKLLGIYVESQVQTADGRADAVVVLEKYVYAFEFKLDGSAEEALQQIKDKGYLQPYFYQNKLCWGIGINFSKALKKVDKMIWEEVAQF